MKRTVKTTLARLGALCALGVVAIGAALWIAGALRVVERFDLPAGAVIGLPVSAHGPASVRVAAGASVLRVGGPGGDDVFFPGPGRMGIGWGTHRFDALRAQGTNYHWRLLLGSRTLAGS